MQIDYRILHTIEELEEAVEVEIVVWGLDSRGAVPSNMLRAVTHGGGVVIGAYHDSTMVGMSFGLPARRENQWVLWSHMTGVIPDYQRHHIGFGLKQAQRTWSLENGYNVIAWTFDPLQRGNANFNLHLLGTIGNVYHENLYGDMSDEINAGMPSDRLETTWILRDERVVSLAAGSPPIPLTDTYPESAFLLRSVEGKPQVNPAPQSDSAYRFVEIPYHIRALKMSDKPLALEWQMAVRETLQVAFARRFMAVDFVIQGERCWYVLTEVVL
jgi:predicted GNAT superfamily acetyltransferase